MLNPAINFNAARPLPSQTRNNITGLGIIDRVSWMFQQGVQNIAPQMQLVGDPRHVGRALTFCITTPPGNSIHQLQTIAEYVRLRTGVPFVRIADRGDGSALVEMPAPVPHFIHLDNNKAISTQGHVLFGPQISDYGDVAVNFDHPAMHHLLLVASHAECIMLFRTLIYQLARQNRPSQLRFVALDKKYALSHSITTLAHMCCKPARTTLEGRSLLEWAFREMTARESGMAKMPRLVILVTEGSYWLEHTPYVLKQLIERGGAVGIHIVLSTSTIAPETTGAAVASLFKSRMVGQMADAKQSDLASGIQGSDCHWQLGDGDTLFTLSGKRFQCPIVSEAAFQSLPQAASLVDGWQII